MSESPQQIDPRSNDPVDQRHQERMRREPNCEALGSEDCESEDCTCRCHLREPEYDADDVLYEEWKEFHR